MSISDIGTEAVRQVAIEARRRHDENQKIQDVDAVKLDIRVLCIIDNHEFAPPLCIKINGRALAGELNTDDESKRNQRILWWQVDVDKRGPKPIRIVVTPVADAAQYFQPGRTDKQRYQAAYSRNTIEAYGREFRTPPKPDDYPAHIVRVELHVRRRSWGRRRGLEHIPKKWCLANNSPTMQC